MGETLTLIGSSGDTVDVAKGAASVRNVSDFEYAVDRGLGYAWASLTYDPDGHDTILLVENNSSTRDLHITEIHIQSDAAGQYVVHVGSGVAVDGTAAVVGVNLNRNSGLPAPATAFCDETVNGAQADGYLLSTGLKIHTGIIAADGNVILPVTAILPNDFFIAVDLTTAATAANVTIIGYYKDR